MAKPLNETVGPSDGYKLTRGISAHQVSLFLKRHGVPVGVVIEAKDGEDGMIAVNGTTHVQVGDGYAVVVRELPEASGKVKLWFLPMRRWRIAALLDDLRACGITIGSDAPEFP
jgi:hypothetical protein